MTEKDLPPHVEPPLQSAPMLEAVVALLRQNAVEVEARHVIEGLPVENGVLSEELLERALNRFGYEAAWSEQSKLRNLVFPCAIALTTGDYLVVVGRTERDLHVLNSAAGKGVRSVPIKQVQGKYAKRVFQVLPSTDLLLERHSAGNPRKHWFWGRLLLKKRSLFVVVLASLFANTLAVVTALFALQVYDRVIPGQSEPTLWVLASGVGLAIFFEAILRISRARLIDQVGKEAEIDISSDIFSRMQGMKLDKRPAAPGTLVHMAREFSTVKEFFTNAAVGVVADLPFSFIFLLLIYGIAGHVVWIVVLGALLIVLPNLLFQRRIAQLSKETMGGMASASRLLTEASYGLEAVKSTRSESFFQRQWEEIIALNALKTTEQRALKAFLTYWATSLQQATYVLVVIACVYLIFAGELSTGTIIAVGILTTRTLSPISQMAQALSSWQNMKTALTALDAVMFSEQERNPERQYIRRPRLEGKLSLQKVRFVHPGADTVALDIAHFAIKPGQRVAIMGANGSGKSSLLRLIAGLYEPTEGEILIDGLDMRQVDPGDLRKNVGFLPQNIQLFRGTLRENLSTGAMARSDDALLEALSFSGLGDFVRHHPHGLDLGIADGGEGLSIGQRQSIGLARLYLQDPAIILLDEPTSALDQNLETTIVSRIGKWIGSRTCIVATHRPQILSEVTHIAVLQQGRIIHEGERDETLKKLMKPPKPKLAGNS